MTGTGLAALSASGESTKSTSTSATRFAVSPCRTRRSRVSSRSIAEFTYAEVGATHDGGSLPPGYHHVLVRERVGHGRAAFAAVVEGTLTWAVHRGTGLRVVASAERAADDVDVTASVGVGPLRLRIPCRVVWAVAEADRGGFAYGTLAGHPESGEESFVVEIGPDDDVWFTVTAFSRPATWYARLGGPLTRLVQSLATRRYVAVARRLARPAGPSSDTPS